VAVTIQLRRDTAANWTSQNPVLAVGERGIETDTGKEKSGDGTTHWTSLAYLGSATTVADASTSTKGIIQLAGILGANCTDVACTGNRIKGFYNAVKTTGTSDYWAVSSNSLRGFVSGGAALALVGSNNASGTGANV
jgi:hypothetical protein